MDCSADSCATGGKSLDCSGVLDETLSLGSSFAAIEDAPSYRSFVSSKKSISTPKKPTRPKAFKVPATPKEKGPIIGVCDRCHKQYRSKTYLDKQSLSHILEDKASLFPNEEQLQANKERLARDVLEAIKVKSPTEHYGPDTHNLVEDFLNHPDEAFNLILSRIYPAFLQLTDKKFCLPSKLLKDIDAITEEIFSDVQTRKACEDIFSNAYATVPKNIFDCFYADFIVILGRKILHFISECVITTEERPAVQCHIDADQRQVIHYVAGSIVKAFLRRSNRFKDSVMWMRVGTAIKQCILEGEKNPAAANSDTYWTDFVNRGGLLVVGEKFMSFMISLVELFCSLEKDDGSLIIEDVLGKLLVSPARSLWDNVIGSTLPEKESLSFMKGVAKSFACSYGRGITLKHMNRIVTKPKASISLRKQLGATCNK